MFNFQYQMLIGFRIDHFERCQKQLEEQRKQAKEAADRAEDRFKKALDDIPGGWDRLGFKVVGGITNVFQGRQICVKLEVCSNVHVCNN